MDKIDLSEFLQFLEEVKDQIEKIQHDNHIYYRSLKMIATDRHMSIGQIRRLASTTIKVVK